MTLIGKISAQSNSELNKEIVTQFYQKAINEKDFAAAKPYLGAWYIQHNPLAEDGLAGLEKYLNFLRTRYPLAHSEIKRVFAEGDYVIVHVHSILEPGTKGRAIIDIFRLAEGKIYEHWDVTQSIPDTAANSNGMF
ncbi:MAG: polyketide cyclase [Legionella sp. 40-6]|nr:nuclear transport factor 2 family protein [Legionella sp.]OJX93213.1 MAG: polyketide cyclase [Legionella sp. 40-6]